MDYFPTKLYKFISSHYKPILLLLVGVHTQCFGCVWRAYESWTFLLWYCCLFRFSVDHQEFFLTYLFFRHALLNLKTLCSIKWYCSSVSFVYMQGQIFLQPYCLAGVNSHAPRLTAATPVISFYVSFTFFHSVISNKLIWPLMVSSSIHHEKTSSAVFHFVLPPPAWITSSIFPKDLIYARW